MATLKTTRTEASVDEFLAAIPDDLRRADATAIRDLMARVTGDPGAMWGPNIVGFGDTTLRYSTGREIDWFRIGFSPRKAALTLYLGEEAADKAVSLTGMTCGKGCVYVKRLSAVAGPELEGLITEAAG